MRIAFTFFPPGEKARGKRYELTWVKLCERLRAGRFTSSKDAAPGISLATFRGDHRNLANTEFVYAVGLDLDEKLSNFDDLAHLLRNCASFAHSTWSSSDECPRARVFLPMSRPVSADEYRRVYRAVVERIEGYELVVDRAASDPSRFWYLPSTPSSLDALNAELGRKGSTLATRVPKFAFAIGNGRPVNVDWALATVPAEQPAPVPAPRQSGTSVNEGSFPKDVERARRWLAARDPAIEGSGGDRHTFETAVCIVRGFDLDPATAFDLLWDWNQRCKPPWTESALRRKIREADERSTAERGFLLNARRSA